MIEVDAGLVERYLLELARHGAYGETGVWRTAYSPEWVAAQDQVAAWMAESGLEVRRDAVGSNRSPFLEERLGIHIAPADIDQLASNLQHRISQGRRYLT